MKQFLFGSVLALGAALATPAQAASYVVDLTGNVAGFSNFQQDFGGLHFNSYFLSLSGLDSSNAITVDQGDDIFATVTLDALYTIPASQVRTDLLLYFFGSGFSGGPTAVNGAFNFYDGTTLVGSYGYSSSTSSQLASFAVLFPPDNGAFSFDSFTTSVNITLLDAPATLDQAAFSYSLVSDIRAVPEPASWALMIGGFTLVGTALRRRRSAAATV
ncbi:PEPxxWA-CTERM sorting domain-containing protein [Polymorphobacter arshaanensis]|uniref:PEPxxWA-CTERM sorting domain-containing protein n=1 Tax=Glacieibacterium arshaanense TaxID=2511025 RepID=UPI00140B9031|nr:PEPxxWA-CTERM sorting domain-containing protein [Polymorphobacter arshaanensis]